MSRNINDTSALEHLGLGPTDIKVFLALLELGGAKAGALMRSTNLQSSVLYHTLNKLSRDGFISSVRRGRLKTYYATDPNQLLKLADERRQNLKLLIPKLEALRVSALVPEAEIYEGINGLKNMCYKLIEDADPGDEFLFFAFSSSNPELEREVYDFYRDYTDTRIARGLKLRGIAHESLRQRFDAHKWPHSNIHFVPYPTLKCVSICNNRVIIVPWENDRISFLITSASFAQSVRAYFNAVWETSQLSRAARKC